MKVIYYFIEKFGTKKNIIFGFSYIVLCNVILFPYFSKLFLAETIKLKDILDLKMSYTLKDVHQIFSSVNVEGRNIYKLSEIIIDFPYTVIYGFTYVSIVYLLLKMNKFSAYKILIFIPFFISFFDVLENISIIIMINKFPNLQNNVVLMASNFTSLKWIFAMLTFVIISFNGLVFAFRKIKN